MSSSSCRARSWCSSTSSSVRVSSSSMRCWRVGGRGAGAHCGRRACSVLGRRRPRGVRGGLLPVRRLPRVPGALHHPVAALRPPDHAVRARVPPVPERHQVDPREARGARRAVRRGRQVLPALWYPGRRIWFVHRHLLLADRVDGAHPALRLRALAAEHQMARGAADHGGAGGGRGQHRDELAGQGNRPLPPRRHGCGARRGAVRCVRRKPALGPDSPLTEGGCWGAGSCTASRSTR